VIKKGYKSFPSGRTSWFLAVLGLLWYLAGKIKAFDRGFHSAKLCIVAMPLILVAMVGVSLVDDYRHHWQDVFTAGVLRLVVVSFCYLQFFPPLSGEQDSSFIPTSSTCLPLKGRTGRGLRRGNRDGVSESQVTQVINIELDQIIEAFKFLDEKWSPKFTAIVAQRNHHTKFFQNASPDIVPPGTVVDSNVCHPRNFDFYMCAHAGMTGTTRSTHYHVLHDEIGFSADDMQEFVHSLSYV